MNGTKRVWLMAAVAVMGVVSAHAGQAAAGGVVRYQLTARGQGPAGGRGLETGIDFHLHPVGWATLNSTEKGNVGAANVSRRWSFETDLSLGPNYQRSVYDEGRSKNLGSIRWLSANGYADGTAFKGKYGDATGALANIWTCWNRDPMQNDAFKAHWGRGRNLNILAGEFVDAPTWAWYNGASWNSTGRYYTKRAHDTASANGNYTGIFFNVTEPRNGYREGQCVNDMRAYGCGQQRWVAVCFNPNETIVTWPRIMEVARYCRDH